MITRDDFVSWKSLETTELLFNAATIRREEIKESLVRSAGVDPIEDAVKRGYCQAIADIVSLDFEEIQESDN